jgi:adenosine tuberculosinyltransferase
LEIETFLALPNHQLAQKVRQSGEKVCVFPINGTRRWFLLEHAESTGDDPIAAYMDITGQRHLDLYRMFFDHGIDTLLTPVFGPDLMERGDIYIERVGADGLARLATHPEFLRFYEEYQVRVRFYGDYRKYLEQTPYADLCDKFDAITQHTADFQRHRLFYGVFAQDAAESIGQLAIQHFQNYGSAPEKHALIEMYYGESLAPVNFFIGFDRLSAFDMPLIANGNEDLYFTTAPSPYIRAEDLRRILYDHLYSRKCEDMDYSTMPVEDIQWMHQFYQTNRSQIMGIGIQKGGVWYPLPTVEWPL